MVVEVCQGCLDFFRFQIRVLPEKFFTSPPIVKMLTSQMDDLVASLTDSRVSIPANSDASILCCRAQGLFSQLQVCRLTSIIHESCVSVHRTPQAALKQMASSAESKKIAAL